MDLLEIKGRISVALVESIFRRAGFTLDSYEDTAEGRMEKNAEGRYWIAVVTLRPKIVFSGEKQPSAGDLDRLHHAAHEQCFIANSVRTEIRIEPAAA